MFSSFSPFLRALLFFTCAVVLAYIVQYQYNVTNSNLVTFYKEPVVTTVEGVPTTTLVGGKPVIVHYYVERNSARCFADYYQVLSGPVSVQFGYVRSIIIVTKTERRELPYLYTIPEGLPAGKYRWTQLIYPTCGGQQADPFTKEIGEFEVK